METIGGGWIIQSRGSAYKFGPATIDTLRRVKQGSPEERVREAFSNKDLLTKESLKRKAGLEDDVLALLEEQGIIVNITGGQYAFEPMKNEIERHLAARIRDYHCKHPLRLGIPKAELLSEFRLSISSMLLDFILAKMEAAKCVQMKDNLMYLEGFLPSYPKQWQRRMEQVERGLALDKLTPQAFSRYCEKAGLPEKEAQDLKYFFLKQKKAYQLDDSHLIDSQEFQRAVDYLKSQTGEEIELSGIKEMLQLSRKYLIPFVELMDVLGLTEREGTKRRWS